MLKSFIAGFLALLGATFGLHQASVARSLPPAVQPAPFHSAQLAAIAATSPQTATPTTSSLRDLSSSNTPGPADTPSASDTAKTSPNASTPTNSAPTRVFQPTTTNLNSKIDTLAAIVGNIVSLLPSLNSSDQQQATAYIPLGDGAPNTIAAASNIGQLTNVTLTNPSINGTLAASNIPAINLASAVSGILPVSSGGTGWANVSGGSILFGNGASALATSSSLYWDNTDGRLGIGTTTPTATLTLDSSSPNGTVMRVSNSSTGGHIYDWLSTGSGNTGGAGRLDLYDYTEGAARLSIASNGNVGIGTTSPAFPLDVNGVVGVRGAQAINVPVQSLVATSSGEFIGSRNYSMYIGDGGQLATTTTDTLNPLDSLSFEGDGATNGALNTFVGQGAGVADVSGNTNTFVGSETGKANVNGDQDAFFGAWAGLDNTDGWHDTFLGAFSGQSNTTGYYDTYLGTDNALLATTGADNTSVGVSANSYDNGTQNVSMGVNSIDNLTTGNSNTAIGTFAGDNLYSGSNNTFLGEGDNVTAAASTTLTNATGVGAGVILTTSNTLILGNNESVGIGYTAPTSALDVNGNVGIGTTTPTSPLYVMVGASNGTIDNFLTLDAGSMFATTNAGSAATISFRYNNDNNYFGMLGGYSNGALVGTGLWAGTNTGAPGLFLTSAGNVGIGTTSPLASLDVVGPLNNTTPPLFQISSLGASYATTTRFIINGSGKVGIGTTTPVSPLYVTANGSNGTIDNFLTLDAGSMFATTNAGSAGTISFRYNSDNNYFGMLGGYSNGTLVGTGLWAGTNTGAPGLFLTSAGNVGVGTTSPYSRLEVWGPDTASTSAFTVVNNASTTEFAVYDTGNAVLSGGLTQNSDQRLKTNVQSLDASSSLAAIDALNPVSFNWINSIFGGGEQLGFIAQAVQGVFPQLVSTTSPTALTPDGTLGLNYSGLIAPVVGAIQALSTELSSLENIVTGFASSFTTNELTFNRAQGSEVDTQELCIGTTCINQQQLAALLASPGSSSGAGDSGSYGASATSTPDTPPVIQINGDNPAIVQVGSTYQDLGATITGPSADLNLGITTYLNGTLASPLTVDTNQPGTDTISYVATDQSGLAATTTRTVNVVAPTTGSADASSSSATTIAL